MEKTRDKLVRERLVARGAESLSDQELLGIIIDDDKGEATQKAEDVITSCRGLSGLSKLSLSQLRMSEDLGIKRAAKIVASVELGRRMKIAETAETVTIKDTNDILNIFQPQLATLPYEEMWVVYLNSINRVIEKRRVSQGGAVALVVDYKLIIKRAVELVANAIILVHNHPSGVATPSEEDCRLTERLSQAADLFDMKLLDHVIISNEGSYSFSSQNKL